MSISERYRGLVAEVEKLLAEFEEAPPPGSVRPVTLVGKAARGLSEFKEAVGEIPQIKLEERLSPALLRAHTDLDNCRLLLEELGEEDRAARLWELEQTIYRLLNSL